MDLSFTREQLLAFARAMAAIAGADGHVSPEERAGLERVIMGVGLSPHDEEVAAVITNELAHPTPVAQLAENLESKEMRGMLLRMMAEMACADGSVAAEERKKVAEAAVGLGYDAGLADELLDWVAESIRLEKREEQLMQRLLA